LPGGPPTPVTTWAGRVKLRGVGSRNRESTRPRSACRSHFVLRPIMKIRKLAVALLHLALLLALPTTVALAGDWPQLHGPTHDCAYAGNDVAEVWPKEGPRKVWQRSVGEGYAGPVVSGGTVVLFHRVADKESVEA